jgi:glycosyltransferase involved in cell wall biosynthesis
MKIAIDISPVLYGTGVSVYTTNLIENLLKIDKENMYILFGGSLRRGRELSDYAENLKGNFSVKVNKISPTVADLLWNRLHIYKLEKIIGRVDIYHSSDWAQAPSNAFKVTTVHDLFPLRYPQMVNAKIASVHSTRMNWVKKEVDQVIAPSYATGEDLKLLGVDRSKITVIAEACSDYFLEKVDIKEVEQVKRKYKLDKYILAVGIGARKNSLRILEAVKEIGDSNLKVVFVGRNQEDLNLGRAVVTGFVDDKTLRSLYVGAECLAYPSLYEGFGLPILQAFASGCPVVTSNLSSMPEVAGDAAVLVDPYKLEDIAKGIIHSIKLAEALKKKGKEQAEKFSWLKTAQKTLELYNLR